VIVVVDEELANLLRPIASERCIKRGLEKVKVLDQEIINGKGFFTVQADTEGSRPHATKIFPDGTFYCSDEAFKWQHMFEKGRLCSHLVASIKAMKDSGIDVKPIVKNMLFRQVV
jgi:hypothetical protein